MPMKKVKEDWAQLPTFLIWMIRDRLFNCIDVFHLSLVCKDWKAASESYRPFKSQSQWGRRVAPWLMMHRRNTVILTTTCEFVNVFTNEKLILHLPEMPKYELLYSKQGWLLFRKRFYAGPSPPERPATLLHLYTNTRIIMPDPGDCVRGFLACFSSSADGNPECVVFAASKDSRKTFCVATVGDNKWTKHSYDTGRRMVGHTGLVVVESKIYSMEDSGSLCIFDMSSLVWTQIVVAVNPVPRCGYPRIMETGKGEIVQIEDCGKGRFKFFKLNESATSWEVLHNSTDMESMSWFISMRRNNNFTIRPDTGVMKKVYHAYADSARHKRLNFIMDVYDLFDGSVETT